MVSLSIIETVTDFITTAMRDGGLPVIFLLMMVESFGIPPLPSEIIIPFAGFLVVTGDQPFWGVLIALLAGSLVGAYIAYAIGRWGRAWLTRSGKGYLRLDPKHMETVDRWFARRGESTVLFARMVPLIRAYISYPAGTAKMEPVRFGVFTLVGAIPFTLALLYAGILLKRNWTAILPVFRILDYLVAVFVVVGLVYIALRWRGKITSGFPPKLVRSDPAGPPADHSPP
ncbi:MAG: DedA family protein [Thermoplasmata archaeon]|nr:DedA family protein [Thermoplasmata archaeon]